MHRLVPRQVAGTITLRDEQALQRALPLIIDPWSDNQAANSWPQAHAADDEAQNMANPDVLVLLAELDGSVIGHLTGGFYAASAMWTRPRAHLISMHVMAAWRGQHVGAQLVEYFRSWAKEKGAVQLRVTAYTANTGAIRFYQRHGFAPLETTLAVDI